MIRKDALAIPVATLVMGVFGAFLRWLQNRTIFDPETGLAQRGAVVSWLLVIYMLLGAAAALAFVLFWLKQYGKPVKGGEALAALPFSPAVSWILCAVFALGGLYTMFHTSGAALPQLQRVFGAAAIIGGACFPFLSVRRDAEGQPLARPASAYASLFFCFFLVFSYLSHAQDPVLWNYVPEILAAAANCVAFYYVAAWFYDRASPRAGVFSVQLAAFLDICTLPDSRGAGISAMFAAAAGMLLLLDLVLINNMQPAGRS